MKRRELLRLLGVTAASVTIPGCGEQTFVPEESTQETDELAGREQPLGCTESSQVVILGGGIAGLSAAHELIERGFQVSVYERRTIPGGKARSMGKPGTGTGGRRDLPGEHGFRFFPGFYRHLPDTMKRIPLASGRSAFDSLVQAPRFLLSQAGATDGEMPTVQAGVSDAMSALSVVFSANTTGISADDLTFLLARLTHFLTACEARRLSEYEQISWWQYLDANNRSPAFRRFLAGGLTRTLVAAKAERMSARTASAVLWQLINDLTQSAPGMDRVLNGPTNEVWLDPWLAYLRTRGVRYYTGAQVTSLELANGRIQAANVVRAGAACRVTGAHFLCALPVERARTLLSPQILAAAPQLAGLSRLTTDWMNGIQFYFDRDVPMVQGHAAFFDSPWALTAISQKQFWGVDLATYGDGRCRGILSVDISDWNTPGLVNKKLARQCTKAEIRAEVWAQLRAHWDAPVLAAFDAARILDFHLDPSIVFGTDGKVASNEEPLLINTVGSWASRPDAVTAIPNLFLCGDYVRTHTDLATMESANESARRAVNGLLDATSSAAARCGVWPFSEPLVYAPLKLADELQFALGLPQL